MAFRPLCAKAFHCLYLFMILMLVSALTAGETGFGHRRLAPVAAQPVPLGNNIATTLALEASATTINFPQSVTLKATVTPAVPVSGTVPGTVQFFDGAELLGQAAVVGKQAALQTALLGLGVRHLTAVYSGNGTYNGSYSAGIEVTVNDLPTPASEPSAVGSSRPGSVLIFDYYTSNVSGSEDTQIAVHNTHPQQRAVLHVFFIDRLTGTQADTFLSLAPNGSYSFRVSQIDPLSQGFLIMTAVDAATGCPISFNYLIGSENLTLASGRTASLGAEAVAAVPPTGTPMACGSNSAIPAADLAFDGVSYSPLPRELAVTKLPKAADGNQSLLVINRLGGDIAASGIGPIGPVLAGIYDGAGNRAPASLNLTKCQAALTLSSVAGAETGSWMRLLPAQEIGVFGAIINFNPNTTAARAAFNGSRNLPHLSVTKSVVLRVPVFIPSF